MRLVFDLETNGLPRKGLSRIHCLVLHDLDTGQTLRFNDQGHERPITEGINMLEGADCVIGHNIVGFDIPVIRELYWPDFSPKASVDTLILSRLFFPDILTTDWKARRRGMPQQLYGRHSLEAWGYRLHDRKDEFGKHTDWQEWSPEMEHYCEQDVHVATTLYKKFSRLLQEYRRAVDIEHRCARWMAVQEAHGIAFDEKAAMELEGELRQDLAEVRAVLQGTFPYAPGREFTPLRNNRTLGYVKDCPSTKLEEFNPTSRDHIAWAFQTFRDWEPIELTPTGKPKIDAATLKQIGSEEALCFAQALDTQKMLGQLSEGTNAWLKLAHEDRIHHSCVLGTNTGRNAHMRPNLAHVSSDPRCRRLFKASDGYDLVGADMQSLELRMLGHYLSYYDEGRFIKILMEGDIHQVNADAVGVTRKAVKSLTYCFIYGGGDEKLGKTYDIKLKGAAAKRKGKELRAAFTAAIPGLGPLLRDVAARGDVLKGIDGRPIKLQGKKHAALNYLLQSAGAITCKLWLSNTYDTLRLRGYEFHPLLFVHDELGVEVEPDITKAVCEAIEEEAILTGQQLNIRCPLAAEAKVGKTWADVH